MIADSQSYVLIQSYFTANGGSSAVSYIRFNDGTQLAYAEVLALALSSTSSDDYIVGTSNNDNINAGAGNDSLQGGDNCT